MKFLRRRTWGRTIPAFILALLAACSSTPKDPDQRGLEAAQRDAAMECPPGFRWDWHKGVCKKGELVILEGPTESHRSDGKKLRVILKDAKRGDVELILNQALEEAYAEEPHGLYEVEGELRISKSKAAVFVTDLRLVGESER